MNAASLLPGLLRKKTVVGISQTKPAGGGPKFTNTQFPGGAGTVNGGPPVQLKISPCPGLVGSGPKTRGSATGLFCAADGRAEATIIAATAAPIKSLKGLLRELPTIRAPFLLNRLYLRSLLNKAQQSTIKEREGKRKLREASIRVVPSC